MSKIEVNAVEPQCGTTLTLGASGDTITIASGAKMSGVGTVSWDTTAKTTNFTAVSGTGYFVNTTSGAITVSLPAGSAGAIVSLADYTNTWQTNNVTVTPNGSEKIGGVAASTTLSTEGQSVTFVYVDATEGWKNVQDSTSNVRGFQGITATGGTITTCGNYKIHTFTSPGTFCVSANATCATYQKVDYIVVAGGAGGGGSTGACTPVSNQSAGGGGAGGYRESHCVTTSGCYTASPLATPTSIPISVQGYPITVGAGGTAGSSGLPATKGGGGNNSVFSTITSTGGGGGGTGCNGGSLRNGDSGGSGGGGGGSDQTPVGSGGTGNTPPTSPPQGNTGGPAGTGNRGGSGGGATAVGTTPPTNGVAAAGGAGATSSITGSPVTRAVGGVTFCTGNPGAVAGGANTGTGGGGGYNSAGAVGGSGIVIIRYRYQ